jgi:predicted N-formylglutamate amidohydrolase
LPRVVNASGAHPVLLVCEHASADMPDAYQDLGLGAEARVSHIAWDPGALDVAERLSGKLDAALLHGSASRLLYDCNRPPEAPDAVVSHSEFGPVPGNLDLSAAERQARVDHIYRPFERALSQTLDARGAQTVLVTIHSFTPVFRGTPRAVEIGVLHDTDARLADALLAVADGFNIQRNAPYGPEDGVMHTLRRHAQPRGLLNVMIEIRNDLIQTPDACAAMAETLAGWIRAALARVAEAAQ